MLNERESGKLSELPPNVYEKAKKSLNSLYSQASNETQSLDSFLTDRTRTVVDEFNSVNETLHDIVHLRSRKILLLAMSQAESAPVDRNELKRMVPAELEMYEGIREAVERCRTSLLVVEERGIDGELLLPEEKEGEVEESGVDIEGASEGVQNPPEMQYTLVRVLSDIEPFMGVDGRVYHLGKEDLITIPEMNADVLIGRNIALNIRVSK